MNKFNDENFEQEVLEQDQPVLVDFWKPGCPPCETIAPVMEEIAEEVEQAKVGKLNVMKNPETAGEHNVRAVPTLIIFNKGEPAERATGVRSKEVIIKKIKELV